MGDRGSQISALASLLLLCFLGAPIQLITARAPAPLSAGIPCDSNRNPCQNGATCTEVRYNAFQCDCVSPYEGKYCETMKTVTGYYCKSNPNPCQNGGTCTDVGYNSFKCNCVSPYEGTYCETMKTDCFAGSECDFYFEGYLEGSVPTLYLGFGTGDNVISTPIVNSKDGGQRVNVINTNQGYGAKPPIANDNQNQFYGGGNNVRVRTFNSPQNVDDFRGKCIKLQLSSVQLGQGDNPMNLNPYDGNSQYPEDRRCVTFRTA